MINKLTFVTGLAVGYVLGTKAGRERYEQIRKLSGTVAASPPARKAGHAAAGLGREAGAKAGRAIGEHLPERVGRHLPDRFVRQGTNGTSVTSARYGQGL
ncbi:MULTISPECIES: YtxH domain-containing protein [unclassified Embleya]|uniref:YtxH domain-containing protein n=1 Tax=unclassified Embleya TaxID=2699296 RepID=UPI003401902E